jgi:hypothetical protein
LEETLKEFMQLTSQPIIPMSQELSLEDTLEEFRQIVNQSMHKIKDSIMVNSQSMHEIKDAAMVNTKAIARLEGQLSHLVAEFNIVEEEELQCQKMEKGQYMIDEDGSNNSHHEHVMSAN